MLAPEGTLTFDFGRHEFGKLTMSWDPDKRAFQYHLHHHWGGTYFHGPKGPVRVGERVALKLFVRPGDWQLYRGEKLLGKIGPPGEDFACLSLAVKNAGQEFTTVSFGLYRWAIR